MKLRLRLRISKFITLALAASMVFTTNTVVFAGEVPTENQVETAEIEEAAPEESSGDAMTMDSTVNTLTPENSHIEVHDGIYYRVDNNNDSIRIPLTTVTYVTDKTDKKSKEPNIATITNTTDPVSWNNFYARALINIVLNGTNNTDTYLNFSAPYVVSENEAYPTSAHDHPMGYRNDQTYNSYRVTPIENGKSYLFVGYGFKEDEPKLLHVAGYDGLENSKVDHGIQEQDMPTIPVTEWDGRKIEYNKSGKHKFTRSKKEILDVKASIVTYSNGVVTEVPGVAVGNVRIDKKALKAASVALDYSVVENKGVVAIPDDTGKYVAKTRMEAYGNKGAGFANDIYVNEYAALGNTMPSFTMSVKLKGAEAKTYKKKVDKLLKDKAQTFFFGVQQCCVEVSSFGIDYLRYFYDNVSFTEDPNTGVKTYTLSFGNIEKDIAEKKLSDEAYEKNGIDCDKTFFGSRKFKISNFREKESKATIEAVGLVGEYLKDDTYKELATLKPGKDYKLVDGRIAGCPVKVLEFTENGNYAYKPMDHKMIGKNHGTDAIQNYSYTLSDDFNKDYENSLPSDLSQLGFKWAFRQSPIDGKMLRYGIYNDTDKGFLYSVD